jgi:hypothetical protein
MARHDGAVAAPLRAAPPHVQRGRACRRNPLGPARRRAHLHWRCPSGAGSRAHRHGDFGLCRDAGGDCKIATGSIAAGIGALWVEHGDPQEISADRPAVKPQGPDKAEMPIYKASTHSRRLARYRRAMSRTTARAHSCSDCCQVDRRQRPARVRDWANDGRRLIDGPSRRLIGKHRRRKILVGC